MANFILPVKAGVTHEGGDVIVGLGTFTSQDEALQTGVRLLKQGKIVDFATPYEQMTLKQYDAWKAAQKASNLIRSLDATDNE